MDLNGLLIINTVVIVLLGFLLFLALFEPILPYKISRPVAVPLDSEEFLRMLEALTDAQIHRRNRIEVLANGEVFYEAELAAIRAARHSINLEAYIFQRGAVTRRFVAALTERARAGVRVNIVLDAVGSFATCNSYFKELRAAGGRVEWYHPFRWYTWYRINNRTHRELLIVDGEVGFIGGAGFADHWLLGAGRRKRWRDTIYRVEGDAVASLQSTFAENWLEASGEILTGKEYFPFKEIAEETVALVVDSSPSAGRSTRGRILFQTLLASARQSIHIATPYFLPDRSMRAEMIRAIKERGVKLQIITAGQQTDHLLTRRSSRRLYGELLKAGAEIYEYEPAMMHNKCMIIDGVWSVVGSTNFDHRSFGLNDEVNLAAFDARFAARLEEDFARDLADSRAISYEEWQRRPLLERVQGWFGWMLERQQ
jgi:cardiolipin synthase